MYRVVAIQPQFDTSEELERKVGRREGSDKVTQAKRVSGHNGAAIREMARKRKSRSENRFVG